MNQKELESFKLSDAVQFHTVLNPKLFAGNRLLPSVLAQLKLIADDFMDELGIKNLHIKDITMSGSNSAFSYTKHSDIDLHLIVDMDKISNDEVYLELFNAKKCIYNENHSITIHGIPVELYVQDSRKPVTSLGEYSVMNDRWNRSPSKRRANLDQTTTEAKYKKLEHLCILAIKSSDLPRIQNLLKTINRYRQAGLDKCGEFSPENLCVKLIRANGLLTKLYSLRDKLHSRTLSIENMYTTEDSSGYIPSKSQRNDPRFKTALTRDIKPDTVKKNAKKFGWNIKRTGQPPLLRSDK